MKKIVLLPLFFLILIINVYATIDTNPTKSYTILVGDINYTINEYKSNATFNTTKDITVSVLVVAGGGAGGDGGDRTAGGGGGGGLIYNTSYLISSGNYTIIVGTGGYGTTPAQKQGRNSSFGSLIAIGGGCGGWGASGGTTHIGCNGGSGGGNSHGGTTAGIVGNGTINQGWNGGLGYNSGVVGQPFGGGGGGGASTKGDDSPSSVRAGNGGNGTLINITGNATYYAGGGGGGGENILGGIGGLGGGGNGSQNANGKSAINYTGGGGGGTGTTGFGGMGGTGIVIIRYITPGTNKCDPYNGTGNYSFYDYCNLYIDTPINMMNNSIKFIGDGEHGVNRTIIAALIYNVSNNSNLNLSYNLPDVTLYEGGRIQLA